MKRRIRKENKKSKIAQLIIKHIFNNKKQYMIAGTLFLIGMMMGIMFINHTSLLLNYFKTIALILKK